MNLHGSLYDQILRKITEHGNQEYVEMLLMAQDCLFIQKGQFHQLIHQLGAIYSQFYGGFLQAMWVANGVKQVNGDPIKGGFQTHEQFAMKMNKSCNRLILHAFCSTGCLTKMNDANFTSNPEQLCFIMKKYQEYRTRWEESANQPSRMVALFLKLMRSYLRCRRAVVTHDSWHLEIESCNLLTILGNEWENNLFTFTMQVHGKPLQHPQVTTDIQRDNESQ